MSFFSLFNGDIYFFLLFSRQAKQNLWIGTMLEAQSVGLLFWSKKVLKSSAVSLKDKAGGAAFVLESASQF